MVINSPLQRPAGDPICRGPSLSASVLSVVVLAGWSLVLYLLVGSGCGAIEGSEIDLREEGWV
jgi:hypothetical protein